MNRIRKRKRRNRRILGVVVGLSILYLGVGFLVLPRVVKTQVQQRLAAVLARDVGVEKVRVNPLTLSVTIEGVSVKERDGAAEFAGWDRLYVNAEFWTSLVGAWRVRSIALDGFRAAAIVNPDGSLNLSDLLETLTAGTDVTAPTEAEAKPARPVQIRSVAVTQARLTVVDDSRSQPFRTQFGPVDFVLTDFHTGGGSDAPYRFEAVTESGERLEWSGTVNAAPFRSVGRLKIDGIVLGKYSPYHAPFVQADVRRGTLSLGGRYEVDLTEGNRVVRWHEGSVVLRDVEVIDRGNGRLALSLPALAITEIEADGLDRKAAIGRIAIEGGKVHARREVDGTINLLRMIEPETAPGANADPSAAAPSDDRAPDVTVGELSVTGFAAEWVDLAAPWPAQAEVTALDLSLSNLTLAEGATMPLIVSLNWAPTGAVAIKGDVTLFPWPKATLQADVADLSLVPFGPYVEGFVNARVAQGTLSTTSRFTFAAGEAAPDWSTESELQVAGLSIEDPASGDEIAGFARLELSGIQATPAAVTVAGITLTDLRANAVVAEDGTLNLAALMKTQAEEPLAAATATAVSPLRQQSSSGPVIAIHRINFLGGNVTFSDHSVQPDVRVALSGLSGTVIGLSSATRARGDVAIKASVEGVGPVAITGRLDPLGQRPFVDLKVESRNVDLPLFSPYSAKYAGYELARGKLRLDVNFRLDDTRLNAENVVTLDQFTFGAASSSPDATKLPVRLAVALLKDTRGQIVIDVPIQGRTDDPEFRIGRVVVRVIVNLLTKAAVSPFALLGSMFGGGGEELAYQEFAPGTAVLLDSERPKLATMIKALNERPALNVIVAGSVDLTPDTEALRKVAFETLVRARMGATASEGTMDPEGYAAVVKAMFDDSFPPGTEGGTPLPPPPPTVTPSTPPEGVIERVVDVFTMKSRREQQAAEAENARRAAAYETALEMIAEQGLPLEEMVSRLTELVEVTDGDLRGLASARASTVMEYIIGAGRVSQDRVILAEDGNPVRRTSGAKALLELQ